MTLLELFRRLSLGELSNLSIGNDGQGTISETGKPRVVMYANEGLQRLYTRFILKEKQLIVETKSHIASYNLRPAHAFSNISDANTAECYILDTEDEPFTGDIIKVLEAEDNLGREYVLNEDGNPNSLFTPQHDVLQVPYPFCGQAIGINYQAKHAELLGEDDEQIELPSFLVGALTAYIGHKIYGDKNTQEAAYASQRHQASYEALCADAEARDLLNTTRSSISSKFQDNGWI